MQSGTGFRLVVRRGPQPNQQYLLTRETITIGRDITNDVVINDPEVSRHHSRLTRSATGYMVEDLRSTNGTFVNRQRLTAPYQLNNGDLVGLGETVTLAYEATGEQVSTMVSGGAGSQPQPQPMGGGQPPAPPPPAAYEPPPPMSMPVADEEGERRPDLNRWIVIGCAVLTVLFCCTVVALAAYIDSQNMWCDVPIISQIVGC